MAVFAFLMSLMSDEDPEPWDDGDDDSGLDKDANYILKEEVLADDENISVKIIDCSVDEYATSVTFNVQLENKTSDKTLEFNFDKVVVNGYEINVGINENIEPETSEEKEFDIYSWYLEECGITMQETKALISR